MNQELHMPEGGSSGVTGSTDWTGRIRRASWGAIFAGLFVTIIIQIILTMLGVAVGASTVEPLTEQNPVRGLGTGAAIWLVVSGLISVFVGSWVAGRLSGGPRRTDGLLHGIVTFSVAEVAMILLLVSGLGAVVGGASSLLGPALQSNAGQQIQNRAQQMLPQGGSEGSNLGGQLQSPQTEQKARQAADTLARGASKGAWWAFAGLLLGLAVSAWGGWAGTASLPKYQHRTAAASA